MNMQTNIDDVRAEIMRLESAPIFDQLAWDKVLADLRAADRLSALADAERRMETARENARVHLGVLVESDPLPALPPPSVAVETDYNMDGTLKAYWVQVKDDEWGMWIHAESTGKAKSIYYRQDPSPEPADFTDLRVVRPGRGADLLDCTPFTDDTLKLAGYPRTVDDIADFPDAFLDTCPCSMCKFELLKPGYRVGNMMQAVEA